MAQVTRNRNHLPPVAGRRGGLFVQPKLLAIICLVVLTGLGWIYVGLMLAGMASAASQSPGARLPILDMLADRLGLGDWGRAALEALCRPSFGVADPGSGVAGRRRSGVSHVDRHGPRHDAADRGPDDPHLC
jgi:hypothetical protein